MIPITPIRRAGSIVVYHPTDAAKVRQFTGDGSPQWVDLEAAVYAECAVTLTQIGTTGTYQASIDLPDDAAYPIHLYPTGATAFADAVLAEMVWAPAAVTVGEIAAGAITADAIASDAVTKVQDGLATSEALEAVAEDVDELAEAIDGIAGSTGDGARTVAIAVTDGTDPVAGARVRVTRGAVSHAANAGENGTITFNLDDGTWIVSITAAGYTFAGAELDVDGDESETYAMTAVALPPPASAEQTTGYFYTRDGGGNIVGGKTVLIALVDPDADTDAWQRRDRSATSGEDGLVTFELLRGGMYRLRYDGGTRWGDPFTVPDDAGDTWAMPQVLGPEGF